MLVADPTLANSIEGGAANAQRVLRALEVFEGTGTRLSDLQARHTAKAPRYNARVVMPSFGTERLNERIEARVDQMIEMGLLNEVEGLLNSGVDRESRPMQALGYRQLVGYIEGEVELDQAISQMKYSHRKYAKRQRTWFRRVDGLRTVDGESKSLVEEALAAIA